MIKLQDVCWKNSECCRKVFGSFDKTGFYLSTVGFKEKYYSCVKCCLVRFFRFRWKKVKLFEKLFLQKCTNCFLCQQRKGVSVHFDEKPLFSKVFVIFQNLSDSKHHISSFCLLNCLAGLSKLHSGVQRNISWRKPIWDNLFSKTFFSEFEQKVLGLFTKVFWQISKKPFYVSRGTVYEKVWDKKKN